MSFLNNWIAGASLVISISAHGSDIGGTNSGIVIEKTGESTSDLLVIGRENDGNTASKIQCSGHKWGVLENLARYSTESLIDEMERKLTVEDISDLMDYIMLDGDSSMKEGNDLVIIAEYIKSKIDNSSGKMRGSSFLNQVIEVFQKSGIACDMNV